MPRSRSLFLTLALGLAVLPGCGKDDTTGPGGGVTFPNLPSGLITAYCVQGQRTLNQSISGTLAVSDCPLGDGSYYEVWHVRVATTGNYRFAASSTFDNVLYVLRLESYTSTSATLTQIAFDDDGSGGSNALISSIALTAGLDYFLVVNGYSGADVGPYTATFTTQ